MVEAGKTLHFIKTALGLLKTERCTFETCRMHQKMNQTQARTRFKEHFGQANHLLITSIVALHTLENSAVTAAPPELHTSWNPQSKINSIQRTRNFILHTALSSAVDSLDMYIALLYRKPNYIRNNAVASKLDAAGRSVARKIAVIAEHYAPPVEVVALVEVLVTWRNNVVHELADNTVAPEAKVVLLKNAERIAEDFRGLDVTMLASKAEAGDALTFKETTSLINAAHKFVQHVDQAVINRLDLKALCRELIAEAVLAEKDNRNFSLKYFSLPEAGRTQCVTNWLASNYGIVNLTEDQLAECLIVRRPVPEKANPRAK